MMNAARLAIVTGGSRGIGAAIVEKLLEMDYQLIVTGKQARESRKGVEYYAVDFSDRDATERFVQMMAARSVDVLVNNAGINQIGSFQEISTDIFDKIQEVNVHAPFRLTQAVIPGMRSRGWGRVVSITSVFSEVSRSFRASYSTSKFGIYGMTTALAAEVARDGVLVN
ncbi:MAG: SDR family NAD(P)-dependent oxidoreductase, partial [Proteobacteria bacterium]